MSDFKSKLPDFQELSSMSGKIFKALKSSIDEIVKDYKEKRATTEEVKKPAAKAESKPAAPEEVQAEPSPAEEEPDTKK